MCLFSKRAEGVLVVGPLLDLADLVHHVFFHEDRCLQRRRQGDGVARTAVDELLVAVAPQVELRVKSTTL